MKKNSKLDRSQKAHARLVKTNRIKSGSVSNYGSMKHFITVANYHSDCINIQSSKKRVLSKSERKKIYKEWMSTIN